MPSLKEFKRGLEEEKRRKLERERLGIVDEPIRPPRLDPRDHLRQLIAAHEAAGSESDSDSSIDEESLQFLTPKISSRFATTRNPEPAAYSPSTTHTADDDDDDLDERVIRDDTEHTDEAGSMDLDHDIGNEGETSEVPNQTSDSDAARIRRPPAFDDDIESSENASSPSTFDNIVYSDIVHLLDPASLGETVAVYHVVAPAHIELDDVEEVPLLRVREGKTVLLPGGQEIVAVREEIDSSHSRLLLCNEDGQYRQATQPCATYYLEPVTNEPVLGARSDTVQSPSAIIDDGKLSSSTWSGLPQTPPMSESPTSVSNRPQHPVSLSDDTWLAVSAL